MSFEKAFNDLPPEARHQVQEIAAYAVLQNYLANKATPANQENTDLVSYALAIRYGGNQNEIARDYQSVMSSRLAMELQQDDKVIGI